VRDDVRLLAPGRDDALTSEFELALQKQQRGGPIGRRERVVGFVNGDAYVGSGWNGRRRNDCSGKSRYEKSGVTGR